MSTPLIDIHCHMLPGLDDGAPDWETTLRMGRMAEDDGIIAVVVTPHQLGNFRPNRGDTIRSLVRECQQKFLQHGISLTVLPGADVRIEPDMIDLIFAGEVVTLGDQRRHVLLELPHEIYLPIEGLLEDLAASGLTGILSHPERNRGILAQSKVVRKLVEHGCLMQVTAGSLVGTFGPESRSLAEWLLQEGLVHFLATDAHGYRARRPHLKRAYNRCVELTDFSTAQRLCYENPMRVASGETIDPNIRPPTQPPRKGWFRRWRAA